MSGRHPDDRRVRAVVERLCRRSDSFRSLWDSQMVASCDTHVRAYRHRVAGDLRLSDALFIVPGTASQRMVVFTAEPGSEAGLARLRELVSAASPPAGTTPTRG